MPRRGWPVGVIAGGLFGAWLTAGAARAQATPSGLTLDGLVGLDRATLDGLYAQAGPGAIPEGRVRGRVLALPGTRLARPASSAARIVWQGKVFQPDRAEVVNRFFGLRMIRADLSYGPSWRDGGPAIILDYQRTSRVYARYRDEVREIAPGLYLGLMYARDCPEPRLTRYFAFEAPPAHAHVHD